MTDSEKYDDINVLKIPKGQHIKDVILRSGSLIHQLGFVTNEYLQLGPVGGEGGTKKIVMPNILGMISDKKSLITFQKFHQKTFNILRFWFISN